MGETDLLGNVRLLRLMPGEIIRYLPDGGEPSFIRFVACDQEGGITFEEMTLTMRCRRTVLGKEFVERFGGAVVEPLGRVMSDQEWQAFAVYLRLAADHGLEPKDLMDFYRFFTALAPAAPTG